MLTITVPAGECFDARTNTFVYTKAQTLQLEHSLVSLSKWESKWKKPFLEQKDTKTEEQMRDYIRCMTITQNVDPNVYMCLTMDNLKAINEYIDDSHTATWFSEDRSPKGPRKIVTAEIIYHWMIALQIPESYQKWHLNRLLTLIRVCNIENTPPKKMSKSDIYKHNRALNASRRRATHSRG